MSHYFTNDPNLKNIDYVVSYDILDTKISLKSSNGIFSKEKIDKGSYYFLTELIKLPLKGNILDFGAGIGVIGITLNLFFKELGVTYCEINSKAIELIKENLKKYNLEGKIVTSIIDVSSYYDYAFLNPPISCGKEAIYNIYKDIHKALKEGGEFYIVIRKDKGMNSHREFLLNLFKEVIIVDKHKGYYILKMTK